MITLSFVTYFDSNQLKFRIQDTSNYAIQGINIGDIKGVIKIITPRGITYDNTDYNVPDLTPASSLYSSYIDLPQNDQGYILAGSYSIVYSVLNAFDSSVSTQTNSYTYSFIVPEILITQQVDGYNSTFISTDTTDYGTYSSLTRVHIVTPPSGSPLSPTTTNSAIITYIPDIYSGIWTSQVTSTLVYVEGDNLVIDAVLTATETITAYLNDMDIIRGYIESFKILYDQARATNKELAYRYEASLLKINTSYSEYDLALYYNDLYTAYQRTVDIVTELSDYIIITFPEEIIPFENHGGATHNPVSIGSPSYGASINASQVLSFSLATISSGGMMPALTGNSTDYFGGDGNFHSLSFGIYALKADFAAYSTVTAITASDVTNWQTAYSWGNHAIAGYALLTNVYTKTQLQTSGQSSVHWGNITNKPTTISGYGITDAMTANSPIIGATHTKITYDSKGLVTGGIDLSASDIPNLSWSKITSGLPTTLAGYGITNAYTKTETLNLTWDFTTGITGKPTTIAGYSITDAYTKTEVDAKTWPWSVITFTPTTLAGYGITDALSTSSPAAAVINSGIGTQFLSDDGTYKTIVTTASGSDTQLIYNNSGSYAGSSLMTFDGTITYIDTLRIANKLQLIDSSTYIYNDGGGNMTFYDAIVAAPYTLADLVGTATNFWIPNSVNIWYGNKVGINGLSSFTEALEVNGNILADNFSTRIFRYTTSDNLLLGPNAGDQETGSNKFYVHNTNTTSPLIYGDFTTKDIIFGNDIYLRDSTYLNFNTSNIYITAFDTLSLGSYDLVFKDERANGGSYLTLSDLRDSSYYSLVSAYTDYSAVITITGSNKSIWNRASYIDVTGAGNKFLSDDGTYKVLSGGLSIVDNILKWDIDHYRIYTSKSEAGGLLSGGKFYSDISSLPTATDTLVYDGIFHSTGIVTHAVTGVGGIFDNVTGDTSDIAKFQLNSVDQCVINPSGINLITGATYKINGVEIGNSFENGLTNTSGTVKLGGALTNDTMIDGGTSSSYSIYFGSSIYMNSFSVAANGGIDFTAFDGATIMADFYFDSISKVVQFADNRSTPIGIEYYADYSASFTNRSLVDKGYVDNHIITPTSNILYWNSTSKYYSPYAASTVGCFDSSSTNPSSDVTRLNYDGILYVSSLYAIYSGVSVGVYGNSASGKGIQGVSTSGIGTYGSSNGYAIYGASTTGVGVYGESLSGTVLSIIQHGTPIINIPSDVISISRTHSTSSYNITGNIITITDNPISSGTISGKVLSVTIGSTERIYFNPRTSASGTAYFFGTDTTLTSGGVHTRWSNGSTGSIAYLDYTGKFYTNAGVVLGNTSGGYYTEIQTSQGLFQTLCNSVIRTKFVPEVSDGATAVAYLFDTHNALSTTGAKMASWKNNGTEKISFTKDGYIYLYGTYAEIYVSGGTTVQSIPTGSTYTKITGFTTNGEYSNCTPDVTNNKITITKIGKYRINMSASSSFNANNVTLHSSIFVDGVESINLHTARFVTNATSLSTMSTSGIINIISANTDIDVRVYHDNVSSVNITVLYANLNVHYLGD